jgi:3-oxoacyl-[acyl-carrier protein] reductase
VTASRSESLAGRTALVTGGGRGIGRAVCLALAREGVWVAPLARSAAELESVAADVVAAGGGAPARPLVADVRDYEAVARALERVRVERGPVDLLVTAAGIARFEPVAETSPGTWAEQIAVTLNGAFHAVRVVLPGMLERRGGDIVMISSVAAVKAFAGCGAYGAAQSGILGFSRALREEVRTQGIRIGVILAGATVTGIWGDPLPVPPERMMDPSSVAAAVLAAVRADPRAAMEEILIRPAPGDI